MVLDGAAGCRSIVKLCGEYCDRRSLSLREKLKLSSILLNLYDLETLRFPTEMTLKFSQFLPYFFSSPTKIKMF